MSEIERAGNPLDLTLSESELETRREHIGSFLESQMEKADSTTAIVALSGGIDSTLVSHLAVDALGSNAVYAMVLPSTVNREDNMSDAERVADDLLDIEYDVIEIEPLVEGFLEAVPNLTPAARSEPAEQLVVGNLRARIRGVMTYLAANHRDGLVVGTGNRSEAAVGYFTKYGDGAVDCHPIANLYKGQVRQLARAVGVPEELVAKPPTAGLWVDQTDEAELGLTYDTLDSILALHIDGPLSTSATAAELEVDENVVEHVRSLYERSAHKRNPPPGPPALF